MNKVALRLDHRALLYDQHGHQPVRENEQNDENGQQAVLLFWSRKRHHRRVAKQSSQVAPRPASQAQASTRLQLVSQ